MFLIFGIRKVMVSALLNFTTWNPLELYFKEEGKVPKRYNVIWFIHVFYIPLLPILYSKPLWKVDQEYYRRDIHILGWIINYLLCLPGVVIALLVVSEIASSPSRDQFRVRMH